jgi:uncharacterized protein (DUF302 family)
MKLLAITFISVALVNGGMSMNAPQDPDTGIRKLAAHHPVNETMDRLAALLKEHGVMIFARIDFSHDAATNGLSMLPEQQLIFGNPKGGTPLMVANPTAALDLPVRAICWQDKDGKIWLGYNDPAYIVARHGLPENLAKNLAAITPLLEKAAAE